MTKLPTLLLFAAVSAASGAEQPSRGAMLAAACHACHGPEGQGSPPLPPLQGRSDLRQLLQTWKATPEADGEAHLMIRFARGLSDRDIDALAAFYGGYAQGNAP